MSSDELNKLKLENSGLKFDKQQLTDQFEELLTNYLHRSLQQIMKLQVLAPQLKTRQTLYQFH